MYLRQLVILVVIICTARLTLQASTFHDPYYTAGVVEFRPSFHLTAKDRLEDNLNGYLTILNSTEANDLDIIVFPESTLNSNKQATFVPNPDIENIVPCDVRNKEYHNLLVQLSCAAKKLASYLVINLTEKEWCSTVPEDTRKCAATGLNLYNTNVVFDRSGAVISRYRKIHLYGENKNTTFMPEFGWFDTDFGVRFGHFICFDILFYTPGQAMIEKQGIKDFIFPSMWFSQLPFLTAVQVQQAWSYANDVNFLASGSSNPLVGSTGSGIYNGRKGIIVAKVNQGMGERKLYKAQVSKYRSLRKRSLTPPLTGDRAKYPMVNIELKRDHLESYETYAINLLNATSLTHEMCFSKSSFCCKFELKWQPLRVTEANKFYQYRLGIYDGLRNEVAAETNQLKNCALFSCIGKDITDCGKQFNTDVEVIFENVTITATFPQVKEYLIMPNSLTADMMPLPVNHFKWHEELTENNHQIRYGLNTSTSNIMAFSIYGNYYDSVIDDDKGEKYSDNGATSLTSSLWVILGILLINIR